jgi:uncharacterized protein with PIN domain
VRYSVAERRILLSRDVGLLKHRVLTRAHYVRATDPDRQLEEVVCALDLGRRIRPFTRCMRCNGCLRRVSVARVTREVPARVRAIQRRFSRCGSCGRVYWPGTHFDRLTRIVSAHASVPSPIALRKTD